MPPHHLRERIEAKHLAVFENLPLRERIADRLSDALLAIDESVAVCEMDSAAAATHHGSRISCGASTTA
jgi:hypothetical protein